ncbi:MAG: DUF5362 family protein [Verrucomicrobiota bacterium JB025]|nr:DUF5362 family protein [Verrucomicrobiota bacterium JB025]
MDNPNPYATPSVPATVAGSTYSTIATDAVIDQLKRTKPWVRLFSVIIFIGAGFMVLGGIAVLIAGAAMFARNAAGSGSGPTTINGSPLLGPLIGISYLIFAALYIYPGLKLWKYASRIGDLVANRSLLSLEAALNEQRAFWKFVGIVIIAVFALYILIAIIAGIAVVAGAAAMQ